MTAVTDESYRRIVSVNVDGVFYGVRAVVPSIEARGGGAIVATASLAGLISYSPDPVYAMTKHAVVGLVRALAPQLRSQGDHDQRHLPRSRGHASAERRGEGYGGRRRLPPDTSD